MKKDCIKKFFKQFATSFSIVLVMGAIWIGIAWRKELVTFNSLQQVNADNDKYPFFLMTYKGDYCFDDYLKSGAENTKEYI